MPESALYERDFYAWANEQASLLRAGKLSAADISNIAEEIESMGKTEKKELESRLKVLLMHLLKWQFQPRRRGASWEATIKGQRRALAKHVGENPSLAPLMPATIADAYVDAVYDAVAETSLPEDTFPQICPWSARDITDPAFWPA